MLVAFTSYSKGWSKLPESDTRTSFRMEGVNRWVSFLLPLVARKLPSCQAEQLKIDFVRSTLAESLILKKAVVRCGESKKLCFTNTWNAEFIIIFFGSGR